MSTKLKVKESVAVVVSKRDLYEYLLHDRKYLDQFLLTHLSPIGGLFLPDYKSVTKRFLKWIVLGKKKALTKTPDFIIQPLPEDNNPDYTVKVLYPRIKNDKTLREYLPT